MTNSFTQSGTQAFTLTDAKYLASKVATDLKRLQRLYGGLTDSDIVNFEMELTTYLHKGYLDTVVYGFKKDGKWIEPTLQYKARDFSLMGLADDDPGKIKPGADISGASFYSYLTSNNSYKFLSQQDKDSFDRTLPFQRPGADAPGINGYLTSDNVYSSAGKALDRSQVKKL